MNTYLLKQSSPYLVRPLYKIGRSVDVAQRIEQISSGCIHDYELVASIDVDIELKLHRTLHLYRIKDNREWFDIDDQTLELLVLPIFDKEIPADLLASSNRSWSYHVKEKPQRLQEKQRQIEQAIANNKRFMLQQFDNEVEEIYYNLLTILIDINALASGASQVFTKKALESQPAYEKLRELLGAPNAKSNKFFTNYGRNVLGFTFSSKRGGNTKYTIVNDKNLVLSKNDLQVIHLFQKKLYPIRNYKEAISYLL